MARAIFSVVAGLIVAVALIGGMNILTHELYPPPPGVDARNPDAIRELIAVMPVSGLLLIVVGWILGAGLGSHMAVRVAKRTVRWPGFLVGTLILLASLYNLFTIPHPIWFFVVAVVGVPLATWIGTQTAYGGGPTPSPTEPLPAA